MSLQVHFAEHLCEVHPMVHWSYAYQAARKGHWEQYARDRQRFNGRISKTEAVMNAILDPVHRSRIFQERFEQVL